MKVNITPILTRLDKIDKLTYESIGEIYAHLPTLMSTMFDVRATTTRSGTGVLIKFIVRKQSTVNDLLSWRISGAL